MKAETVIEVVEKLIGNVEATGETYYDEDAFINLGLMKGVCDALLIDIYESSKTKNRHEYSMEKVGSSAYMYLKDLRDWLDEILGETE